MARGRGLGLPLAPALEQMSHLSIPITALRALSGRRQGFKGLSAREAGEMREDGVLEQPPSGTSPGTQPFPGEQLQGMENSSVADMEPSKPFCSHTGSVPRTHVG